jgi:hypothetical protein
MTRISRWCLGVAAAVAMLAATLSASQAFVPAGAPGLAGAPVILTEGGGYDNDAIAQSRGFYRGPAHGYYQRQWGPPAEAFGFNYRCTRQLVPVQRRDGTTVWRWREFC